MIKKILPYLLSFAIILSAFASLPFSAAESAGNLKPATIADRYSADGWHRTYPSGGKADNGEFLRHIKVAQTHAARAQRTQEKAAGHAEGQRLGLGVHDEHGCHDQAAGAGGQQTVRHRQGSFAGRVGRLFSGFFPRLLRAVFGNIC